MRIWFSFTILGNCLNLVLFFFFFYIWTFYFWNTCRNKTRVCGSYPRTNLPQAIPDPSAGIPICSEMNNPHIPLFPSHTVNTCNIYGDTSRRLSSCSPPQLCSSREVVSPDVIPIILPSMFYKSLSLIATMQRALNSWQALLWMKQKWIFDWIRVETMPGYIFMKGCI